MATRDYEVGNIPPQVLWTLVRGDSTAFRIYVTDETKTPLVITDWVIDLDIRRGQNLIVSLFPAPRENDVAGEFTVYLTPEESELLETGDIFDVQLTRGETVWTVVQGRIVVIEDVTAPSSRLES
jgi:hypothetical protein